MWTGAHIAMRLLIHLPHSYHMPNKVVLLLKIRYAFPVSIIEQCTVWCRTLELTHHVRRSVFDRRSEPRVLTTDQHTSMRRPRVRVPRLHLKSVSRRSGQSRQLNTASRVGEESIWTSTQP